MSYIQIAIADDYPYLVKGLRLILQCYPDLAVDIEALNGKELLEKIEAAEVKPNICLLDLSMPVMDGYEALVNIKTNWPEIKVIILSQHYNEYSIIKTIRDGASACLPKEANQEEIYSAIKEVNLKGYYHTEFVAKHMSSSLQNEMKKVKITDKEKEFLRHCCSDLSYQQIADAMKLSCRTVEGYRDAMFQKLDIRSRSALVMFAIQAGFVQLNKALI